MRGTFSWLLALLLIPAGCSSPPPAPSPKTPLDFMTALIEAAGQGQADTVLGLLSDDAKRQTGRDWFNFISRTRNAAVIAELQALPKDEFKKLETLPTEDFLKELQAQAPRTLAKLFSCYYQADAEDNGEVLVLASNSAGDQFCLAMARQSDGTLKLLSDAEFQKTYKSLYNNLVQKLNTPKN
jgi:hypothetical protein